MRFRLREQYTMSDETVSVIDHFQQSLAQIELLTREAIEANRKQKQQHEADHSLLDHTVEENGKYRRLLAQCLVEIVEHNSEYKYHTNREFIEELKEAVGDYDMPKPNGEYK